MSTTFTWDNNALSAWATDHWGRAGAAPKWPGDAGSNVADKVIIISANPPTGGPLAALTVAEYTCRVNSFDCGANLTVSTALTMGTVLGSDSPIFSGTAAAGCVVWFRGESFNTGVVGDNATFDDHSHNNQGIGNYATFNDASYNISFTGVSATLNDTSTNHGAGQIGDLSTFNTSSPLDGRYSGSQYYVAASAVFMDTSMFLGADPIIFSLTTTAGAVHGTLTTDGGTTPLHHTVDIDAAAIADLITGNLRNGKTVLGVAGAGTLTGFGPYPIGSVAVGPFPIEAASIGPYHVV